MIVMGDDFAGSNQYANFKELDKFIDECNNQ